ncbi:MAG: carboxylesterase family protein, partial [Bacilli bacterium]|nr:carboxylesterase family protein [Bacilli bacterium]
PYAKPPVGELRWKEPQPVDNWEGVKNCAYFASRSMQTYSNEFVNGLVNIYAEKSWHPNYNMSTRDPVSEDSLYLNIWRPAKITNNLPILVYIHGGSLTSGSSYSRDINGETMARNGVIMVTVAYRLGVFGYFAHPDLAKESPNGTTGNYGLLDQIQALKWVNENASYFGGDKNNITIAGESAGSSSVSAICSSPLAKGLFKRAIGESSSVVGYKAPHTFREMSKAQEVGANIMKEMKCSSIEELRKVSAKRLVNTKYSNSEMTVDGYALPKTPYEIYKAGENNEEALLNGYNVKEADAFVIPTFLFSPTNKSNIRKRLINYFDETAADQLLAAYNDEIQKSAFSAFNQIISAYWFMQPHMDWSSLALANGENVYRYQFTKENGHNGNYHAGELIYAYGNIDKSEQPYAYNSGDKALSNTMVNYWANFVKTGNPNGGNNPTWNKWTSANDPIMELGVNVGPIEEVNKKAYSILDEWKARKA